MADYTALVDASESLTELLRHELTPEPINDRELISLANPFEAENNQLTIFLFQIDEDLQNGFTGYQQETLNMQRMQAAQFQLSYLITAHSKAPVHPAGVSERLYGGQRSDTYAEFRTPEL